MIPILDVISCIVITGLIVGFLWMFFCCWLRDENFKTEAEERIARKTDIHGANGSKNRQLIHSSIQYQNEAIYRAFEFFFKMALGTIGGMTYVMLSQSKPNVQTLVIQAGGILLFFSAIIFSIIVALHQKSKIERWTKKYNCSDIFTWVEFYLILGMLVVAVLVNFVLVPKLSESITIPQNNVPALDRGASR